MRPQSSPTLFAVFFVVQISLQAQQGPPAIRNPPQPAKPAASSDATAPGSPASSVGNQMTPTDGSSVRKSQINGGLDALGKVLEEYRKSGDRVGEAGALCAIASAYSALGQQQKALEHFELALAIYRETSETKRQASTLSQIGDVYRAWGFPQKSLSFYHEAIAIYTQISNDAQRAVTLNNLGVAYLSLRDRKKCLSYLMQAIGDYHSANDLQGEALALNNLGMAYSSLANDTKKALESFHEALARLQLADDHDAEATVLDNMGAVCLRHGRKELAASSLDHALELFRGEGDANGEARVLKHMRMLNEPGAISPSPDQ